MQGAETNVLASACNRIPTSSPCNAAQISGKVNPDLTIKVLSSKDLGASVGKRDNP